MGLLAALAAAASFAIFSFAADFSASDKNIQPGRPASGGGRDGLDDGSYKLSTTAGEVSRSTMTAASTRLRAGVQQIRSYPGAVTDLASVSNTSTTINLTWTAPGYDGGVGSHQAGTRYLIQRESDTAVSFQYSSATISVSTSGSAPGEYQSVLLSALDPNTTYFVQLWTLDPDGNISPLSNRTTAAVLPKLVLGASLKSVFVTSVTATWIPLPTPPPQKFASEGYVLEASSTNFGALFPGGEVFSSATPNVALSTLTVNVLGSDSTYYFRVGAVGWDGAANYAAAGSTKTVFAQIPPNNTRVEYAFSSSATVIWSSVNSDAGYRVEASTMANFSGTVSSKATVSPEATTLTVSPLLPNTTYFLRVAALWIGNTQYANNLSTPTLAPAVSAQEYQSIFLTSATVTWAALPASPPDASSKTAEGYRVEASSTNFGGFLPGGLTLSSQTRAVSLSTLTIINMAVNTTYYFRVGTLNWNDMPHFQALASTSSLTSPPGAGAVGPASITSITASWDAGSPSNPSGQLYVLRASSSSFAAGTTVVSSETYNLTDLVTGLLPNTTYQLRIRAPNWNGVPADTVLGTTVTMSEPPGTPAVASVFTTSLTATWTTVTGQGYRLEASSTNFGAASPGGTTLTSQTANGAVTGLTVVSLFSNTTYFLRVAALNWNSHPSYGLAGSTVTLSSGAAAVQIFEVFETSATVNWEPLAATPSSATAEGYLVEASTNNFGALTPGGIPLSSMTRSVALSTLTVVGLAENTTYYYRMAALNWNDHPSFVVLTSTPTRAPPPGSPEYQTINVTSMTVSWTAVASQGYEFQASVNATFTPLFFSSTTNAATTSLSVTGLAGNTTYFVRVGAFNQGSNKNYSQLNSTATMAVVPTAPRIPTGLIWVTSATVQWTNVASQGYRVEAATSASFSPITSSSETTNGASTNLRVENLDSGTTYFFRVGSLNHNNLANYAFAGSSSTAISPKSWTGATNTLWNTATNWSPSGVPGKNDSVTIGIAANVNANTAAVVQFSSLTIGTPGGVVASLTLSTGLAASGDVKIHRNSGLTLASTQTLYITGMFTMMSGSSLTHATNGTTHVAEAELSVSEIFYLLGGATMTAVGRGFSGGAGGNPGQAGSGPGAGGGTSLDLTGGGGGGHGGAGSGGSGGSGGNSNDSAINPVNLGSGGGGGRNGTGGAAGGRGGGLFRVTAATISISGLVKVDGTDGANNVSNGDGGGGSGGGVYFNAQVFTGTGTVTAKGGAGGATKGGGGGGGIVSVAINSAGTACDLTFDVAGGTGTAASGGNGVVSTTETVNVPGGWTALYPTTYSIHWNWQTSQGASSYQIFSSTGGNGQSPVLGSAVTSYTTINLAPNITHTFFVRASNCASSAESGQLGLATLAKAPSALAQTYLNTFQSSVTVAWAALPDNPVEDSSEGYLVQASTDANFNGTVLSSQTLNVYLSTLTVENLLANNTYFFRVASLNSAAAAGPYLSLNSTSTLTLPINTPQVYALYGGSITANWAAFPAAPPQASSMSAEGYRLVVSQTPNFTGAVVSSATTNVALSTLTQSGLDSETTYYLAAGGLNWNDKANLVSLGFVVTKDTTPPGNITSLAAATGASSTTLNLSWNAPGDDGPFNCVTNGRYRVDYATYTAYTFAPTVFQVEFSTSFCPGDGQSLTLNALLPNTTHFVRVMALDEDLNGNGLSNGTTAPTLPPVPSLLAASFPGVFSSSITAAWARLPDLSQDVSSKTAQGYRLEASSTNFGAALPGGILFSSATANLAASTLTVSGLTSETTYYFRVGAQAHNGAFNYLTLGSTKAITNFGQPPENSSVFRIFQTSMTMLWTPVNSEGGYELIASTDSLFFGTVRSSATINGDLGQLTVSSLLPNTTYFLKVGSILGQTTSFAAAQSTSTLAENASGFDFKGIFFTSVTVTWVPHPAAPPDASSKTAEGYALQASTASTFYGTVISSSSKGIGTSTLTLTGLSVNTTYFYRVGSLNWGSATNYALLGGTATLASFPAAGSPLFTEVFLSSVTASWTSGAPANPSGTRYLLEGSSTAFAAGTAVASSITLNTAGSVSGLLANTTYTVRVSALNRNGIPSLSLFTSTATLATEPTALTNTHIGVFETSATIAWAALPPSPDENSARGYRLDSSSTNFGAVLPGGAIISSQTTAVAASTLTLTGLDRNTTYYFRVASLNWNTAANFTGLGSTVTYASRPSASQIFGNFETSATINWSALPASPQAATAEGYLVEASTTNFGALLPGGETISSQTRTVALSTLTAVGLSENTTYFYRVASLNWPDAPNFAVAGSTPTRAPAPGNAGYSAINVTSMTVSWTAVASQGYELQASVNATFTPLFFSSTTNSATTSLGVTGLAANTTYFVRVGALNHGSNKNYSQLNSTATMATLPTAPRIPSGLIWVTSATVQWTNVAGQGYRVDAATDATFSPVVASSETTNSASTNLRVINLDAGTTFFFRVGTLNHNGVAHYAFAGSSSTLTSPRSWTGATNALWNTATNWSPSGVPGKNDSVTIGIAANVNAVTTAIQFSSLTIGSPGGVAASLTLATGTLASGDVKIYKNAGLTIATTHTIQLAGDLTLISGSSLSHATNGTAQNYETDLNIVGAFNLLGGATMTAVGRGYQGGAGGNPGAAGSGPGSGGGTSLDLTGGGGGGHGGAGSAGSGGAGGGANDSAINPANLGSGGGGGRNGTGGASGGRGGGLLRVTAATARLHGLIDVSGTDGGNNVSNGDGGGGAGGAVYVSAGVFEGTGTIRAKGAPGGDSKGGGGGGGIVSIAINTQGSACDLTFDVAGATGTAASGADGVVSTTDTVPAPAGWTGLFPTTYSIHWLWQTSPGASSYQIFSSTGGNGQSPSLGASATSYTTINLAANTTHTFYVRAQSCGQSVNSATFELATLSVTPQVVDTTFLGTFRSSATVAWAAMLGGPPEDSANGYRLEASTASDFTGTVLSSETAAAVLSTLTVSGLIQNTTHFFRVASFNQAFATSAYLSLGSTATLAVLPQTLATPFLSVFQTSATVAWAALPAAPPEVSSMSSRGYVLEASSTNFGALTPGGVISGSATANTALSTLTVSAPALLHNTVHYFRVGSLNWQGGAEYTALGSTLTRLSAVGQVTVASAAVQFANNQNKTPFLKLSLAPAASAVNGLRLLSARVQWTDAALTALTNAQAQALFSTMSIVADSLTNGATGTYEAAYDTAVVVNLTSASFALDGSGLQVLTVPSPAPAEATAVAGGTRTFFVIANLTGDASAQTPNTARAVMDADADVALADPPSGQAATVAASASVTTSSTTAIAPAVFTQVDLGGPPAAVQSGWVINDNADTTYGGSDDGKLRALNNDNSLKWSFTTSPQAAIKTFPSVVYETDADYVYFANNNGDVYKIKDNGATASQVWKRAIGGQFQSAPTILGATVYMSATDGKVYKLKYNDGTDASGWSYDAGITGAFTGTPYVDEYTTGINAMWVGSQDGNMYKIKTADGTLGTSTGTAGAVIRVTPNLDSGLVDAAANSNNLYWGADDGVMRARTSANLTNVPVGWTDFIADPQNAIVSSPFINRNEDPKGLYFGCDNGKLYKLNAATGALVWSYQTGGIIRITPIVLVAAWTGAGADYVYFGSDDGYVYGVNAVTGAPRSKFPLNLGAAVRSGPTFDSTSNTITVGSTDGKVLRISVGP